MPFSDTFLKMLMTYPPTKRKKPLSDMQIIAFVEQNLLEYLQELHTTRVYRSGRCAITPAIQAEINAKVRSEFPSLQQDNLKSYEQYKELVRVLSVHVQKAPSKTSSVSLSFALIDLLKFFFSSPKNQCITDADLSYIYTLSCFSNPRKVAFGVENILYCRLTRSKLPSLPLKNQRRTLSKMRVQLSRKDTIRTPYVKKKRKKLTTPKKKPILATDDSKMTADHPMKKTIARDASIPKRHCHYKLADIVSLPSFLEVENKSESGQQKTRMLLAARRICVAEDRTQWYGTHLSRGALYGFWPRLCYTEIDTNGESTLWIYHSSTYTDVQYGWFSYGETRKKDGHIQIKIWRLSKKSLRAIREYEYPMPKDLVWQAYWMRIDQHRIAFDLYVWLKLPLYKIKLGTYGTRSDKCLLCDNKTHAGTAYCQYHLREQGWTLK